MTHFAAIADRPLWYAAQVHQEERALSSLLRARVEAWCPMQRTKAYTRSGKAIPGARALFPGYLFTRFDAALPWEWIGEVDGVVRVLAQNEKPVPIMTRWIEGLRERIEADGGALKTEEDAAKSFYRKRQPLRVTGGPFQSLSGLYEDENAGQIRLWLDIFGRNTLTVVSEALVEPIEPACR